MVRVQQGLLVSQFLSVLVAGGIVALASFFYFNPNFAGRRGGGSEYGGFSGQQAMGLGQVDLDQSGNEFSGMAVTAEKDTSGLKYRKMIESFLLRADRSTVDPTHTVDRRMDMNEACIQLLVDLSEAGRQVAEENGPREFSEMLVKIASYAKAGQSYDGATLMERRSLQFEILKYIRIGSLSDLMSSVEVG